MKSVRTLSKANQLVLRDEVLSRLLIADSVLDTYAQRKEKELGVRPVLEADFKRQVRESLLTGLTFVIEDLNRSEVRKS